MTEMSRLLKSLQDTQAKRRSWHKFLQLWPEIHAALASGYAIRDIHAALMSDGRWESGYEAFRQLIARARMTTDVVTNKSRPTPSSVAKPKPREKKNVYLTPRERPSFDYSKTLPPDMQDLIKTVPDSVQHSPLSEPWEGDPYDYSGMSEEGKKLL